MDEDSQQLPESPRDSQQLPESPPPNPKHAAAIHSSPLPSSRSSLSSFESIVASGMCFSSMKNLFHFNFDLFKSE